MSLLIRTDELSADERVDFVREMSATLWVPMDFHGTGEPRGEFRASGLGAMQVVVLDIDPLIVRRTTANIAQGDPDMLKACMMCGGGRAVVTQGERQAVLEPGEFAFYDTRRPYEVVCGTEPDQPVRMLTFMFPPSLLPLHRNAVGTLAATRIAATPGLGELTSQFLLKLARGIDHYTPAEAARLSTAALEVLATRLAHELDAGDWGTADARRHALLTTIQGFILQHLGDSRISPAEVAAAHHVSLRTLHQLFHDEGLTVAGWTRSRRLDRCRRDLADPALDARPVAAIAARWGFSSPSDFGRAFRAAYGMPPAEYRKSARDRQVLAR